MGNDRAGIPGPPGPLLVPSAAFCFYDRKGRGRKGRMSGKGEKERGQNQLLKPFVLMHICTNTLLYRHLCLHTHTRTCDRAQTVHTHARVHTSALTRTGAHGVHHATDRSQCSEVLCCSEDRERQCVWGGGVGVSAPLPHPQPSLLSGYLLRAFVKYSFSTGEAGLGMISRGFPGLLEP